MLTFENRTGTCKLNSRSHVVGSEVRRPLLAIGGQSIGQHDSHGLKQIVSCHILPEVRIRVANGGLHGYLSEMMTYIKTGMYNVRNSKETNTSKRITQATITFLPCTSHVFGGKEMKRNKN